MKKIINPYLLQLLKSTIICSLKGSPFEKLDDDDFSEIDKITGIKELTLKRWIFGNSKDSRSNFTVKYLNKLCLALPKNCDYLGDWNLFEASEGNKDIAKKASLIESSLQLMGNDKKKIQEISLKKEIIEKSNLRALQIVRNISISHIPLSQIVNNIRPAKEDEIYNIYDFALLSYEDCELNGPDIKLPWWRKNNYVFYVYFNSNHKIKANINLLPLKGDCYTKLKNGSLLEKEIESSDIYSIEERELVKYIYCEGLNVVDDIYLRNIGNEFENIINIFSSNTNQIIIGAFGGTLNGDLLMEKLGFEVVKKGVNGREKYKFYEIAFTLLLKNIQKFLGGKNNIN